MTSTAPVRTAHLTADAVSKGFEHTPVVSAVSLTASAGERLGVVGENGRGKTTLLRLLAGDLAPDRGAVVRHGSVALVAQELPVRDGDTVDTFLDTALRASREAVAEVTDASTALAAGEPGAEARLADALARAEALDAWGADRRADVALAALGAPSDRSRPMAALSVGQRHRVRLACVLAERADVLLLDEPTNHLDGPAVDHLTAALRAHPGVVVLVSHDRMLLDDVCTAVLDLDPTPDGEVRLHGGGWTSLAAARAAERARWEQRYALESAAHAELTEQVEAARTRLISSWRPDKGANKHKRATRAPGRLHTLVRRLEDLDARRVPAPPPPLAFTPPEPVAGPDEVLLGASGVVVPHRLHLTGDVALRAGGRLLVSGVNGAGKSTLLHVLGGRIVPAEGAVHRSSAISIGLLAQESSFADETATPADLVERAGGVPLGELGLLDDVDARRPVGALSTGQRRRLSLALLLAATPHVLLLDEPTNHLSTTLVDELTAALRATTAAVVVATHDRRMRADLADWPDLAL
jgi:macrolide transport system ATP-binding/permease protein